MGFVVQSQRKGMSVGNSGIEQLFILHEPLSWGPLKL